MKIHLASASPRRLSLLQEAGFDVCVCPSDIDESQRDHESPYDLVQRLAIEKAQVCKERSQEAELIVAADTLVCLNGRIFAKAESKNEALEMISALSGKSHEVISGYCVISPKGKRSGLVSTSVTFRHLSREEIERYIDTGEYEGKSGSYAIQGRGIVLVDSLKGSLSSVVGLPLSEVMMAIKELG